MWLPTVGVGRPLFTPNEGEGAWSTVTDAAAECPEGDVTAAALNSCPSAPSTAVEVGLRPRSAAEVSALA